LLGVEKLEQTMKTKRKKHSGAFKAKVGMDAILGIKTVAQIAREYQVHPVQVTQWKTLIRERLPQVFEPAGGGDEEAQRQIAQLHQKIGELTVDLDYVKKKCKQLGL
jgi:transposase